MDRRLKASIIDKMGTSRIKEEEEEEEEIKLLYLLDGFYMLVLLVWTLPSHPMTIYTILAFAFSYHFMKDTKTILLLF